jgi:transcriptional regulator with XRE-family HTH domain
MTPDRNSRNRFGLWLKRQREARNLTRQQLATELGWAANTVIRLEDGIVPPTKQHIADAESYFRTAFESSSVVSLESSRNAKSNSFAHAYAASVYSSICRLCRLPILEIDGLCPNGHPESLT